MTDRHFQDAVDGLSYRAGLTIRSGVDRANDDNHMTLAELAKSRLELEGVSTRGLGKDELFGRALTASDFTNILADVANKALLEGFEEAEETYETWVDTTGKANDFRDHVFARASEAPELREVNPDGGEYGYAGLTDAKETVAVVDYGIIVPFTRLAMVNDDVGALSDLRAKLGAVAKRKYGDLVYAVLTGNPAMGDGVLLFHADHGNYVASGSGAAPSVGTLNAAATAMATQKDLQGLQALNVRPQFVLAPWALKGTVDNLVASTTPAVVGSATTPGVNPWRYLTPVYDARLDAALATGWYLAAPKGKTVKLFTLGGQMVPHVEARPGWNPDGVEFKCRITAAAKAMDFRGLYFNYGA